MYIILVSKPDDVVLKDGLHLRQVHHSVFYNHLLKHPVLIQILIPELTPRLVPIFLHHRGSGMNPLVFKINLIDYRLKVGPAYLMVFKFQGVNDGVYLVYNPIIL